MAKSRAAAKTETAVVSAADDAAKETPRIKGAQKQLDGTYKIKDTKYSVDRWRLKKADRKAGESLLSNFMPEIKRRLVYHDGDKKTSYFELTGYLHNNAEPEEPIELPEIRITSSEFSGMSWPIEKWGPDVIIFPEANAAADLKTAIQAISKPEQVDIYTHTGWSEINGRPTFLHHGGGITAEGVDTNITVQLPQELQRYTLPAPNKSLATEAMQQSLFRIVQLGPPELVWPLLMATYRAAVMEADFALHIAGRTGSFKSELASLLMSHYGAEMDARHLPAGWNATANALEALAYRAKNALMVIDDFVPVGGPYQIKQLNQKVDQLIRAQGNGSGRARMSDATDMRSTMFPRGIILSTGEEIPDGHSVRGRMLIREIERNDISAEKLSEAQKARRAFPQAMANWIQWIAETQPQKELKELATLKRDELRDIGHSRTPSILGELIATAYLFERYVMQQTKIPKDKAKLIAITAEKAIIEAGRQQLQYLETADPVNAFCETIRGMISQGHGHFQTINGGAPNDATLYGWQLASEDGESARYKPNKICLGWIRAKDNTIFINADLIPMIIGRSQGKISLSDVTLMKRIGQSGLMKRRDTVRSRNTVRVTAAGAQRNCLELWFDQVFPQGE